MNRPANANKRHRFPPAIIQYAVWLYYRFNLSHRDTDDLLAWRGIVVTQESIRLWRNKFGPQYARQLRRRHRGYGDTRTPRSVSSSDFRAGIPANLGGS
jgi:putative transposase